MEFGNDYLKFTPSPAPPLVATVPANQELETPKAVSDSGTRDLQSAQTSPDPSSLGGWTQFSPFAPGGLQQIDCRQRDCRRHAFRIKHKETPPGSMMNGEGAASSRPQRPKRPFQRHPGSKRARFIL
ncbi:hypothetical protein EYF80_043184 [Liparis tanakae]|uniref:Uncharacterized protein n=1 Tax=Liparis tanakae TaxID=230148 RepID=A0A4Z2FZE2_9TELE|nr:hypothetical protein EYF80_043184 [Liparis tanakae]